MYLDALKVISYQSDLNGRKKSDSSVFTTISRQLRSWVRRLLSCRWTYTRTYKHRRTSL